MSFNAKEEEIERFMDFMKLKTEMELELSNYAPSIQKIRVIIENMKRCLNNG